MKTKQLAIALLSVFIFFISCEKDGSKGQKGGTLEIKCINPIASTLAGRGEIQPPITRSNYVNPQLVGDTTETYMISMKICFGDVWVSKEEVKAGEPDNLEWIRLTKTTNTQKKYFEEYTFPAVEIPAGTYKSIKITLKNVGYRLVALTSDLTVRYELLETMGSWSDPCDRNDDSWANTNYFSTEGNHYLDENGLFKLMSSGEKIGGFTIQAGKKAVITWRFGAGATETCKNYLIDENGNRKWDCGTDRVKIVCPPSVEYMWDFVISYE